MFNSTNGTQFTMPVVPAGGSGFGNGFADGNGWFIWVILILIIFNGFGWGGYGNGGFGGANGATSVYEGYVLNNDFSTLSRQIDNGFSEQRSQGIQISNGIASLGYDQLAQMNNLGTSILTTGNAIQTQLAQCCCDAKAAIGDVKYTIGSTGADISRGVERGFSDTNYNLATQANGITNAMQSAFCQTNFNAQTNTRDIVDSQKAGTRAILDKLCQMESNAKDEKINELTAKLNKADLAASQAAQNTYLIDKLGYHMPIGTYQVPNPFCNCNCNTSCCGC